MSLEKRKNILFVSHDARRTGAPIVLINFIKWVKHNTDIKVTILCVRGGELTEEFSKLGDTNVFMVPVKALSLTQRIIRRFYKKTRIAEQQKILNKLGTSNIDLVYLNTVVANEILPELMTVLNCPVVCHVHENEYTLKVFCTRYLGENYKKHISKFIAVSQSTAKDLADNFSISRERIFQTYEFIYLDGFQTPSISKDDIRKTLNIKDGDFVIGASGHIQWRKAPDWFLLLALFINKLKPVNNIRLLWMGDGMKENEGQIDYELKKMGFKDNQVSFLGIKTDPENYFQVFDAFALTSREDPFPLVCIESAALGKPIVCFNDTGGIPEMLSNGGGFTVPYGDVLAMAEKMILLSENRDVYEQKSREISVIAESYDVNKLAPGILKLINHLLDNKAA